eukprot:6172585-Pleurochrysis_carterae.AAC.2
MAMLLHAYTGLPLEGYPGVYVREMPATFPQEVTLLDQLQTTRCRRAEQRAGWRSEQGTIMSSRTSCIAHPPAPMQH